MADSLIERYPMSRRKAELAAVKVLEDVMEFYEAVAEGEEG